VNKKTGIYGSSAESLIYPLLLLVVMWSIWALEAMDFPELVQLGIRPQQWSSLKGIVMMPLLHDPSSVKHILNNSLPAFLLLAALIFYYREIAWRVFVFSWIGTGIIVWYFAKDQGAYHIGFSGVVYALFGFLFLSGFLRRIRNLQALTLAVSFLYGSMIWGMFPIEEKISWEGHMGGFVMGVLLAIIYRKHGPQVPKYQYEIEKELGIEPPDLEGIWLRNQEELRAREEAQRAMLEELNVVYHYLPREKPKSADRPLDDTAE
jgi:membrane associated rhomboid family serine protease